jgi:hypothetical protein
MLGRATPAAALFWAAAPAAALLWCAAPARAQSLWDRGDDRRPVAAAHTTAEYRVEEPIDVWAGSHSTWTAVDGEGRSIRRPAAHVTPAPAVTVKRSPAVAVTPVPAATAAPSTARPRMPLPESVIRATLQAGPAPFTAGTLLRGGPEPAPSDPLPGVARIDLTQPDQEPSVAAAEASNDHPPPFPVGEAEMVSHDAEAPLLDEERTYSLFDPPSVVEGELFPDEADDSTWRSALAGFGELEGRTLPAPPAEPSRDGYSGDLIVPQDGLDAVNGQGTPPHNPYLPVPLHQIRPYRSYSPEGLTLCPSPDARCPEIKPMPGSSEMHDRAFAHLDYLWVPANVFYSPLYFEDPYLERYGHTHGPLVQPFVSTGRFAVQLISLPYQVALDPPHRRVYPLGFYRPGECAPKQVSNVPLNAKAAAASGAVYTGLIFAFP